MFAWPMLVPVAINLACMVFLTVRHSRRHERSPYPTPADCSTFDLTMLFLLVLFIASVGLGFIL